MHSPHVASRPVAACPGCRPFGFHECAPVQSNKHDQVSLPPRKEVAFVTTKNPLTEGWKVCLL